MFRSCDSSRGGKFTGRVKNPRAGWGQKHGKRGQGTIERDELNTEGLLYTY